MEFGFQQDKYQAKVLMKLEGCWYGPWKSQCLTLRAWGRQLLQQRGQASCAVTHGDLRRLGHQDVRVAVGLSRPYVADGREDCWPMVVAVITDPPLTAEVDYNAL